jgi:hypothetical protein
VTYWNIEANYPGWENSFKYPNRRFARYIEQKKRGRKGSTSETVTIAIAVFNFLKQKYIEQIFPNVPMELIERGSKDEIHQYITDTYGNDPETFGCARTSDIVEAVLPSHPRNGADSPNAKPYSHKNKTLVHRVLAEMTDLYLIERYEASWKKTYYCVVMDASGGDFDLTKEELVEKCHEATISAFLQADRYRAAIDIMKANGIPSPEQQVEELIRSGGTLYTSNKELSDMYKRICVSRRGRLSPGDPEK